MLNDLEHKQAPVFNNEDKVLFFSVALFFLAMALLIHLRFNQEVIAAYRIFLYNFFGAHYKLPPETPKPVIFFLSAIPTWVNWAAAPLLAGFFGVNLFKIARLLGAGIVAASAAVVICLLGNNQFFVEFFWAGFMSSPMLYVSLSCFQLVLYLQGRYKSVFAVNFISSLIRPESWLCAVVFYIDRLLHKDAKNPWYYLPVLAPFVWMFCDWRISGDWFLSFHITHDYQFITQIPVANFWTFWPIVIKSLSLEYPRVLLLLGMTALGARSVLLLSRSARVSSVRHEWVVIVTAILPFLLFWGMSLGENFALMTRFFSLGVMLLLVYAACLCEFLFGAVRKRYIYNSIYIAVICVVALNTLQLNRLAMHMRIKRLAIDACSELLRFLKDNPGLVDNARQIIVPGRMADEVALSIGEDSSQKIVFERDIIFSKKEKMDSGIMVFIVRETASFDFLTDPYGGNRATIDGRAYIFKLIKASDNGMGFLYSYTPENP